MCAIEERDVLRRIEIQPKKAIPAEIPIKVANILGRVLAAASGSERIVPPVILHESAAAPKIRLLINTGRNVRPILAVCRDVSLRMSFADINREKGSDQSSP